MFSTGKKRQFYHILFQLGLLFNQGEKTKWVAGLVKHSEVTFEALPQFTVQVVNSIDIGSVCKKMYFLLQGVLFQSVFSNKSSQMLKMLWDGKCTWQQGLSICSSLATASLGITERFLTQRQFGYNNTKREEWYHNMDFGLKKIGLIGENLLFRLEVVRTIFLFCVDYKKTVKLKASAKFLYNFIFLFQGHIFLSTCS